MSQNKKLMLCESCALLYIKFKSLVPYILSPSIFLVSLNSKCLAKTGGQIAPSKVPLLQNTSFFDAVREQSCHRHQIRDDNVFNLERRCPRPFHFTTIVPGRVAQSVGHLTRKSGVLGSIPGLATYFRFSFRFFKKGSCQLLAKVCARSTG